MKGKVDFFVVTELMHRLAWMLEKGLLLTFVLIAMKKYKLDFGTKGWK